MNGLCESVATVNKEELQATCVIDVQVNSLCCPTVAQSIDSGSGNHLI